MEENHDTRTSEIQFTPRFVETRFPPVFTKYRAEKENDFGLNPVVRIILGFSSWDYLFISLLELSMSSYFPLKSSFDLDLTDTASCRKKRKKILIT